MWADLASGVIPGIPTYCEFENLSNIYGMQLGLGGEYGHKFVNISLNKLVSVIWGGAT